MSATLVGICTGLVIVACGRDDWWRGIGAVMVAVCATIMAATFVVSVVIGSIG